MAEILVDLLKRLRSPSESFFGSLIDRFGTYGSDSRFSLTDWLVRYDPTQPQLLSRQV